MSEIRPLVSGIVFTKKGSRLATFTHNHSNPVPVHPGTLHSQIIPSEYTISFILDTHSDVFVFPL